MQPSNRSVSSPRISAGSRQLLVGPASAGSCEQMKVRLSTRATSRGSEAAWNEFGRRSGSRRLRVPRATSSSVRAVHSARSRRTSGWPSAWSAPRLRRPRPIDARVSSGARYRPALDFACSVLLQVGETVARLGAHHSVAGGTEKPNVFNDNVVGEIRSASCSGGGMFSRSLPDYEEDDPAVKLHRAETVTLPAPLGDESKRRKSGTRAPRTPAAGALADSVGASMVAAPFPWSDERK
jgi:hypothetical protein